MIEERPVPWRAAWIAILLSGGLLQACALEPRPTASGARVYAADLAGSATNCTVGKVTPASGQTIDTEMKVENDGGWCGLPVRQPDGKSFDVGVLSARPAHGSVMIHRVGDDTRVDYTPDRTFSGSDSLAVTLFPGGAVIRVTVTVTPPAKKA